MLASGKAYSTKSEIWSLGVTLYFMLCFDPTSREASFPWWGATDVQLVKNIFADPMLKFSPSNEQKLSYPVKHLLRRMLEVDEDSRIDWNDLFSSPLFSFELVADPIFDRFGYDEIEEEGGGGPYKDGGGGIGVVGSGTTLLVDQVSCSTGAAGLNQMSVEEFNLSYYS